MPKYLLLTRLRFSITPPEGGGTPPSAPSGQPVPTPPALPAVGPNGFPENTPVKDMAAEQQAAYWQHQARKHEDRSKEKDRTIADLQKRTDPPPPKSDTDKALDERIAAALAPMTADLVSARIEAAVARRGIDTSTVQALIDALDVAKFLKDGKPDTDKITAWAAALPAPAPAGQPATGAPATPPSPGTGGFQGRGGGSPKSERSLADGAAMYEAEKGNKAATPFT